MPNILQKFLRPCVLALSLSAVPLVPAWAQMVLHMPSAAEAPTLQKRALSLAVGESLRLESLKLDDASGRMGTAELRRITAMDSTTRFIERAGDQSRNIDPPARAHFSGHLAGKPGSAVFVSVDAQGAIRSIIDDGGEVFINEVTPGAAQRPALAVARRVDKESDFLDRTLACEVTPEFIEANNPSADVDLQQVFRTAALDLAPPGTAAASSQRRADIIIETDHELFLRFGDSSRLAGYITDLFGYINTRYQSEIGTRLNLSTVYLYPTPADPWTRTNPTDQLAELREYWNAGLRAQQARHHVHLLSAKEGGGGVSYVGVLNNISYSYGVSTAIKGDFSANNPQLVWDSLAVAHEIGHAFGSTHTHNYDKPYLGSTEGGAIDCCYADSSNSQCGAINGGAGARGVLPGLNSIVGGQTGQGTGTIMSYCHLLGSYSNISFTFGTNHPYGVNAWRVADVMLTSAQSYLPFDSAPPPPPVKYTLSVTPTGNGQGTVSSSPAGINCGTDCSEEYLANTTVTLTAVPATGNTFDGWSGACIGSARTCNVTMDAALNVRAAFTQAPTTRLITVSKSGSGSGSISSSPAGLSCAAQGCSTASANFPSTAAVTLMATAATGSSFGGWSGACTGTASSCTLAAGATALNVTAAFNLDSGGGGVLTNPTLFVMQQYADLFNRSPDAAGLNYWANQLQSGAISQAKLIETFMAQPDFKGRYGPLVRLYTAYFQRTPDYDGLMYWYGRMYPSNGSKGLVLSNTSEAFAQSAEFISTYGQLNNLQFVELVYQNVLGRMAEPEGRDYWVGRLNAGLIRGEMMIGFSESPENVSNNKNANSITMTFAGMLRRMPYAEETDSWLNAMNAGYTNQLELVEKILSEYEYIRRFQ